MSGRMSRQKGKRFEREVAALFRAAGYDAIRGVQYEGGSESPDVRVKGLPIHIEAKAVESLNIWAALAQAQGDAAVGKAAVVVFKRNRSGVNVAMSWEDFDFLMKWQYDNGTKTEAA